MRKQHSVELCVYRFVISAMSLLTWRHVLSGKLHSSLVRHAN
jgi:hypothetical protein